MHSADIDSELLQAGRALVEKQKAESFWGAWKRHWPAAVWSMILSTALIMEGYDTAVVSPCHSPEYSFLMSMLDQLILWSASIRQAVRYQTRQEIYRPSQRSNGLVKLGNVWSARRSSHHWILPRALRDEKDVYWRNGPHDRDHLCCSVRKGFTNVNGSVSQGWITGRRASDKIASS